MSDRDKTRIKQDISAETEALIRERFNSLSRLIPGLYSAILINTVMLAWLFHGTVSYWVNGSLALFMACVVVSRGVYWYRFRGKAYTLDLRKIRRAIRGTAIFGPALSLTYSIAGFFLIRDANPTQQALTLMSIWIVASASAFCVFSLPFTAMLILASSSAPLCLALIFIGDSQLVLETPALISVSALMAYILRENHKTFTEIVNSRTKMRHLQDELGQNHKHLEIAQKVGAIGSAEVNLRTGAMNWSDEFFALLGLDHATVTPSVETFIMAIHPDDRDIVRQAAVKIQAGLNVPPMELRALHPDNTVHWLSWASELLVTDEDVFEGFIVTIHDVTERIRIQTQLVQSQKLQAVGQLTGGVAHDFNNLLAVILGRLQMLEEELHTMPNLLAWVRSSIKAVEHGATLTRSLLAFARRQTLMPAVLDLNAVVDDVEDMLRRTLGETYEFRVIKTPDLWRVEADPGQLQNALLNLVLNARDAMPKGGTLTVEIANAPLDAGYANSKNEVRPGDYTMLAVSDTGTGMPPDVAERAFEPFFTTKDINKGSGLGLSMVYGFVRQSGGHVVIDSEIDRGTTVRIYLPRKIGAQLAAPIKEPEVVSTPRGTEKILVVEDNDELRQLTRLQLERLGYTVLDAGYGAEGLRVLHENPDVNLLLTDIVMPQGMSGHELAEQAAVICPRLKVMFMSGYSEHRDAAERSRGRSAARVLRKPFHLSELATQIRAALD